MQATTSISDLKSSDPVPTGKRQALIDAAQALFVAEGFHGTQIADITRAAGTGISTFYRYFEDKEALLSELMSQLFVQLRAQLNKTLAGIETMTPLDQFASVRTMYRTVLGNLVSDPLLARMLLRVGYGISERIDGMIWAFVREIGQDLTTAMTRSEETGLINVRSKDILAQAIVGTAFQVGHSLLEEGGDLEQAVDICTRFSLGGLIAFAGDESFASLMPVFRTLLRTSCPALEAEGV